MRVEIKHHEKTEGWISKKTYYVVDLTVIFTEEERHIIEANKLQGVTILERGVPADRNPNQFKSPALADVFNLRIGKLLKETDSYSFSTSRDAKEYEVDLREQLPRLKEFILENAAVENKSDSFEL